MYSFNKQGNKFLEPSQLEPLVISYKVEELQFSSLFYCI